MKRHIGKIFEFNFEGGQFFGLCVYYDDTFGYLLKFSKSLGALNMQAASEKSELGVEFFTFVALDVLIRRGHASKRHKLMNFNPYLPKLRGGGGRREDGSLRSWMIYGVDGWQPVEADDPILPELSECRIIGIGSVKDILDSGTSRSKAFKNALNCQGYPTG